jgi:pimeloyl-ACP methyl ester carboxylesterase
MTEKMFVLRRAGDGLAYWEAGAGAPIVAVLGEGGQPSRAHALLAERRRVIVFAPSADITAPEDAAGQIEDAIGRVGVARCDLIGEGTGAAAALRLALAPPVEIGAVVLSAPDGPFDDTSGEVKRPVLVLCGTQDQPDAARRCCATLPDCHFMLVYDAGPAIGADRPEALAFIALEFFERRDLFLVSRESGQSLP